MWLCIETGFVVTVVTLLIARCLPQLPNENFVVWKIIILALTFVINIITKLGSKFDVFNFPEWLLHLLSLIGGATALPLLCINHKSTHTSYQDQFMWMCCGQVIFEIASYIILPIKQKSVAT